MRWVSTVFLAIAAVSPVSAQDDGFATLMRDVNAKVAIPSKEAIKADALLTLQAIAREDSQCVPTGVELEKPTPATAARIAVQGIQSGQLKNLWMVHGRATGCPSAANIRFAVLLMANDEVRVRQVNEGESLASMSLMRDTSASAAVTALSAIQAVERSCTSQGMQMLGTRIISRSADLSPDFYGVRYKGSWVEGWTFKVCGRRAEVPVYFTADGEGGAFTNIKSTEVHLLD